MLPCFVAYSACHIGTSSTVLLHNAAIHFTILSIQYVANLSGLYAIFCGSSAKSTYLVAGDLVF